MKEIMKEYENLEKVWWACFIGGMLCTIIVLSTLFFIPELNGKSDKYELVKCSLKETNKYKFVKCSFYFPKGAKDDV